MTELIFSYGTLQTEKTQRELFGRRLRGTKDVLRGYKLSPIEIADEAFLAKGEEKDQRTLVSAPDDGDIIEGTVLEISKEELLLCDAYEPESYVRFKVVLQSGKEAWTYAAADPSRG